MGCCQSTARDPDEIPGEPAQGAYDGAAAGQHASQTALTSSQPGAYPAMHRGGRAQHDGGQAGFGGRDVAAAAAALGPGGVPRERQPLRQHAWTGRHRNPRSHQGDVAASRKVWTRRSLDRERAAFFDTRVSNRPDVWLLLREVVALVRDQDDLAEAQALLAAAGVTVPSGDLADGAYDETGNFYPLVEYVVSDPKDMRADESDADEGTQEGDEKGKEVERVAADAVEVRARLSNRGGPEADVKVPVSLGGEPVRLLARRVRREAGLPDQSRLRIAYLGRVLKESRTLEEQGYKKGDMVNALVSE